MTNQLDKYNSTNKKLYQFFDRARIAIINEDKLAIDMTDTLSVPTSFMNTSFGELINLYGFQNTKSVFDFINIRKTQIERFRKYFEDYKIILKQVEQDNANDLFAENTNNTNC